MEDIEALASGGRALCHMRFELNRSMMRYMRHALSAAAAFTVGIQGAVATTGQLGACPLTRDGLLTPNGWLRLVPPIVRVLDLKGELAELAGGSWLDANREPDGAATGNGADDAVPLPSGVDSQLHTLLPLSVSRRVAPSAISPIQPQVNPEQMQAVKDIASFV